MFDTHTMIAAQQAEPKPTELLLGEYADNSHVREVLVAAATRSRNLSVVTLVGTSAPFLLAMGMTWSGLGVIAIGTLLYGSLVARDSVDERFLARLLRSGQDAGDDTTVNSEGPQVARFGALEGELSAAYQGVVERRSQLQKRMDSAPPMLLKADLLHANRVCDSLLANARRLVARGQQLSTYLQSTSLTQLSDSAATAALLGADSTDAVAAEVYRQTVEGKRRQIGTYMEVQGLYDRVLAHLMLIEATLAGAVASLVKITAAIDAGSLSADLIATELEVLVRDVSCLEQGLDELHQSDSPDQVLDGSRPIPPGLALPPSEGERR